MAGLARGAGSAGTIRWRACALQVFILGAVILTACAPPASPPPGNGDAPTAVETPGASPSPVPAGGSSIAAIPATPPGQVPQVLPQVLNVAALAQVEAWGKHPEQVRNAVDGNPDTFWWSEVFPRAWIGLRFDRPYIVDRVELVVSQTPTGNTVHEVWAGNGPDLTLMERLAGSTTDGQTLTVALHSQPVTRVLVRTLESPSQVAWREVRVFGVAGAPAPPGKLTEFVRGGRVDSPVGITHAGDGSGRLFVLQQQGRIWVVSANGERRSQPFLEIPERVSCCTERGLLGLAFPPGYAQKRYFYLSYTSTARPGIEFGDTVISRFALASDADAGNPQSEKILLVIPQASEAHHGGKLEFGPRDGLLYVSTGDGGPGGGAGGRAQRTDNLQGKILRIDVESGADPYGIPASNPYVGREGYRPEVLANGLRNPWGMTFDPPTGDLYIADAGETEWEEVNVHRAGDPWGLNYGWPVLEGRHCYPVEGCNATGLTPPVSEYHHLDGCAVTGGAVARSARYQRLQGAYLFADFCSGRVWAMRQESGRWETSLFFEAGFPISTVGRDETGNVYVADYSRGQIWRVDE